MLVASPLASCTKGGGGGNSDKPVLYVYNWGTFIDKSVNTIFEEEFGCTVMYETYDSNEAMYQKVKGSTSNYDVVFPSDYMVEKMVKEGMLAQIDKTKIPNFANIQTRLKGMDYDPTNTYSIPYFWGTVGILYNTTMVEEPVDSWEILWNEDYKGQIIMYDSQRDSLAVALKALGYSANTRSLEELKEAEEKLIAQKPLVMAYYTDIIVDMMIGEEAALSVVYSGDAIMAMEENEDLAYAVPMEGSNVWFDNVAILSTSKNKELAEEYINFLCRDDISMLNTEEVMYSTANKNVAEELQESDWAGNDTYFVPDNVLARCEVFLDLGEFVQEYANAWLRVKGQ